MTEPAIDTGEILEALNDKVDRDCRNVDTTSGADAVIEWQAPTAANNYTWYRLYKSGWVEQGGIQLGTTSGSVTVTLPITMKDTKYCVLVTSLTPPYYGTGSPVSETQVKMETRGHDYTVQPCSCSYQVSGMSAQS